MVQPEESIYVALATSNLTFWLISIPSTFLNLKAKHQTYLSGQQPTRQLYIVKLSQSCKPFSKHLLTNQTWKATRQQNIKIQTTTSNSLLPFWQPYFEKNAVDDSLQVENNFAHEMDSVRIQRSTLKDWEFADIELET